MKSFCHLILILVLVSSHQTVWSDGKFDPVAWELGGLRGTVVAPATDKNPFQSEGTTVKLKDGTLLHAFNLRFSEENMSEWHPHYARTVIGKVLSGDGGKTWSAPQVMFESNTGINASHPAVRRLPNGELGATYQRINTKPLNEWDRDKWLTAVKTADKIFRYSTDEGKSWSTEVVISPPGGGYWTSAHDRLIVHSSGRLIQPLHTHPDMDPDVHMTKVAWSDDNGRTWNLSKQWIKVDKIASGYIGKKRSNFHEAAVAEREDGSIFMIGRTSAGRLYWSESYDRGETWTEPEPSALLSPEAPANVARLPGSSDLVLIWNSQGVTNRSTHLGQRLTLASVVSSDGGHTWGDYREIITIQPHKKDELGIGNNLVCYPSLFFDNGFCYVGYWAGARVGEKQYHQQYVVALPIGFFTALRGTHEPGKFVEAR